MLISFSIVLKMKMDGWAGGWMDERTESSLSLSLQGGWEGLRYPTFPISCGCLARRKAMQDSSPVAKTSANFGCEWKQKKAFLSVREEEAGLTDSVPSRLCPLCMWVCVFTFFCCGLQSVTLKQMAEKEWGCGSINDRYCRYIVFSHLSSYILLYMAYTCCIYTYIQYACKCTLLQIGISHIIWFYLRSGLKK